MTTAKTDPSIPKQPGGDLLIVDNADEDWKVSRYLHDWCEISRALDIATCYFEIGLFTLITIVNNRFQNDWTASQ